MNGNRGKGFFNVSGVGWGDALSKEAELRGITRSDLVKIAVNDFLSRNPLKTLNKHKIEKMPGGKRRRNKRSEKCEKKIFNVYDLEWGNLIAKQSKQIGISRTSLVKVATYDYLIRSQAEFSPGFNPDLL